MPAATMRTSTSCSSGASSSISSTRIASPAAYNTAVRVFINTCPLSLLLHILVLQGYHQCSNRDKFRNVSSFLHHTKNRYVVERLLYIILLSLQKNVSTSGSANPV